jgi:aldehyde dehydrogenase (NAD(P)+)
MRDVLRDLPSRADHYPGAARLYEQFLSSHPEAEQYGSRGEGRLPWGLIAGIDPSQKSDICFKTESFCPIIAETGIEATSIAEFIDLAVQFSNERLWGTLSAAIIIHPRSLKDPAVSAALDRALENLQYGAIIINSIQGLAWAMTTPPWGSYPGNAPWDIQSGTGFVHNTFMFTRPQKVVVRAPFRTWPRPLWFPSRAAAFERVVRDVVRYELQPSWWTILKIIWGALKG